MESKFGMGGKRDAVFTERGWVGTGDFSFLIALGSIRIYAHVVSPKYV